MNICKYYQLVGELVQGRTPQLGVLAMAESLGIRLRAMVDRKHPFLMVETRTSPAEGPLESHSLATAYL